MPDIEKVTRPLVNVMINIETELIENTVKFVSVRPESETAAGIARWYTERLSEVNALTQENIELIRNNTPAVASEIEKLIEDNAIPELQRQDISYKKAIENGVPLRQAPPIAESEEVGRRLNIITKRTKYNYSLIARNMAISAQNEYVIMVNEINAQVSTGLKTFNEALKVSVRNFSDAGIVALIDNGGKKWSTDGYSSMVIRTEVQAARTEATIGRANDYGWNLMAVSAHSDARPLCAPYQGKVYTLKSEKEGKYPPLSTTSVGEAAGLFGINCGHRMDPYFPGVSTIKTVDESKAEIDKNYQVSQVQRRLERKIRDYKRREIAYQKAELLEDAEQARQKVRESQAQMRSFINQSGRTRRYDREQVLT